MADTGLRESDDALYSRQKINFRPPGAITHLVAAKQTLVLGFANNKLTEIHLKKADHNLDLEIGMSSGDGIGNIFIDPTGRHVIVSTLVGDNFYRDTSSANTKLKLLTKLKGYSLSSVGWNLEASTDDSTGFIVLGTCRGTVIETEISSGNVQYAKLIYELQTQIDAEKSAISGLQLAKCSKSRYVLLVSTSSQFVPMIGQVNPSDSPVLLSLCANTNHRVHSLDHPADWRGHSSLRLYKNNNGKTLAFAWLAAAGIRYGTIDCEAVDGFNLVQQEQFLMHSEVNGRPDPPLSMQLTEYHLILLYWDRVVAVCTLNQQTVYEDVLGNKLGKLLGMSEDPFTQINWVFSQSTVLKYKPNDENRHVWKIFADRGDFHQARITAGKDPQKLNTIIKMQAEALLHEKKYVAAAELLAMTDALFEEVCLKLVQCPDPLALRTFIDKKLDQVDQANRTQQCMLVLWLLELHLTHLNQVTSSASDTFDNTAYKNIRTNLDCFLHRRQVVECLHDNQQAAYKLVTSHGDNDCLLLLATLLQDWDKVITLHLQQERYDQALQQLIKLQEPKLFYKFSSGLLEFVPQKLVDAWMKMNRSISPKRLLPSMFNCQNNKIMIDQVLRYLWYCVKDLQSQDSAIHNLLLSLLVRTDPNKLMEYLKEQGTDPKLIYFDIKYALRLCTEHSVDRACVHLYTVLGMHEDAVSLALKFDVKLAQACVTSLDKWDAAQQDLAKKLWLTIARHVVETENDMDVCMQLMQDSQGALQIQDILPFFPHFATIHNFKDSLCECLKAHSGKVQKLQTEMKEATVLAQDIRNDMNKLSKTYCLVRSRDVCDICENRVLGTDFYLFPCNHFFHSQCLQKEVSISLDEQQIQLLQQFNNNLQFEDTVSVNSAVQNLNEQASEIDQLIASECPWCGDHLIGLVDKPFATPSQYAQQLSTWEIK